MLPEAGMYCLALKVRVGRGGRAWCSRRGPGACQVAAIIGSWLRWGVICGGSKSVEHVCGAFGLTAGPGASIIPVSRGAMGRVWCLDLGAERYAVKELFWESDEESVHPEEVPRGPSRRRRLHRQHRVPHPRVDPPRPRLRLAGPLMTRAEVGPGTAEVGPGTGRSRPDRQEAP